MAFDLPFRGVGVARPQVPEQAVARTGDHAVRRAPGLDQQVVDKSRSAAEHWRERIVRRVR
jgi:hypothetical protein